MEILNWICNIFILNDTYLKWLSGILWLSLIWMSIINYVNIISIVWVSWISLIYVWLWYYIQSESINKLVIDMIIYSVPVLGLDNQLFTLIIVICLSLLLTTLNVIFRVITDLSNVSGLLVFDILGLFGCYWTLLWSLVFFYWILEFNFRTLEKFYNDLSDVKSWNSDQTSVSRLSKRLIEIRYDMKVFMGLTPLYFMIYHFGGGTYMAVIYNLMEYSIDNILTVCIFLLGVILTEIMVLRFQSQTDDLKKIAYLPNFAEKYIVRHWHGQQIHHSSLSNQKIRIVVCGGELRGTEERDEGEVNNVNNIENSPLQSRDLNEIGSSVDWLIFSHLLKEQWITFDLMGFKLTAGSGLFIPFSFMSVLMIGVNLFMDRIEKMM